MQNQPINGISSSAVTPQINYVDVIQQLEQAVNNDIARVKMLMAQGIITSNEAQYLVSQLVNKANIIESYKQLPVANPQLSQPQPPITPVQNPFDLFNQEKPGFFDGESRGAVLDYIRNLDVDKDEITKIAALIEGVEKGAVDGYLKKSAHDKSLNDENSAAKSKLTSYAQNASNGGDIGRIFTREDIGNMSGEEFAKNEKLIMEQVRQGLIK